MPSAEDFRRRFTQPAFLFCLGIGASLLIIHFTLPDGAREAVELRIASGRHVRTLEHALTTTWWTTLTGGGLMLFAGLTASWWTGGETSPDNSHNRGVNPWSRGWWVAVCLIVAVAGGIRLARLNLSLYNDEAYSVRRHMVGEFRTDTKTDELKFREPSWVNTLWFSEVGNNSPPYSVAARLTHSACAKGFKFTEGEIREWPLRLPAWFAGMGGILLAGLLARQFGTMDRGLLAMVIAAFHPWHIRYSSEARGHSLLLLFIPLLILLILKAVKHSSWRNWLLVGLVNMLTMWAFPGAMYVLMALNLALGVWLMIVRKKAPSLISSTPVLTVAQRWLLATAFGALIFMVLYGPAIAQMRMTVGQVESLRSDVPWSWWLNITALMISGQPWADPNATSEIAHSITRSWATGDRLQPIFLLICLGITLAASIMALCRGLLGWLVSAAVIPALALAFFTAKITQTVLHEWYTLSSLPLVIVLMALGMTQLVQTLTHNKKVAVFVSMALICGWLGAIHKPLLLQLHHGIQPIREAVEVVRGRAFPYAGDSLNHTIFAAFWADISVYDPNLIVLKDLPDLKKLEIEAEKNNKDLVVCFAHRSLALHSHGPLVEELESSGNYLKVRDLRGFGSAQFNHHIFRRIKTK